jgi:hypothetical protein
MITIGVRRRECCPRFAGAIFAVALLIASAAPA